MSQPDYIQPDLPLSYPAQPESDPEQLDAESMSTVQAMLAVMNAPQEIESLQSLTATQRQQVWAEAIAPIRAQLERIHPHVAAWMTGQDETLRAWTDPLPSGIAVGQWVVLTAEPHLSTAELLAIWQVVAIHGDQARIQAERVGTRRYPMAWMRVYPQSSAAEQPSN